MHNQKVVLLGHSLGAPITHYLMAWAEEKEKEWCERHMHSVVHIGAPLLGVPRAFSALLSGDSGFEKSKFNFIKMMFSRDERVELLRNSESVMNLLPNGADEIWGRFIGRRGMKVEGYDINSNDYGKGNGDKDKKVNECANESKDKTNSGKITDSKNNLKPMIKFEKKFSGIFIEQMMPFLKIFLNKECKDKFFNPLNTVLPHAPNLSIYSFYGIVSETETGYCYKREKKGYFIDREAFDEEQNLKTGTFVSDGDGTVPLISLGYMGRKGWKNSKINPAQVRTVIREYKHRPLTLFKDLRGGPQSAGHTDILGNVNMIRDVLMIVSGGEVNDRK